MRVNKEFIVIVSVIMMILLGSNAFSRGLDNSAIGIRAPSMGYAFTAVANDSSAVYFNPAGLVYIEKKWDIVGSLLMPISTYYYKDTKENRSTLINFLPGGFISYKSKRWAIGIGVYVPYNIDSIKYENHEVYNATYKAKTYILSWTVSGAFRIIDMLSIGAGLDIYYGKSKIDIDNSYNSEMSGVTACGNLGVMIIPIKDFNIGLKLKMPTRIKMKGEIDIPSSNNYDISTESHTTLPWYITFGLAYTIKEKITISMDLNLMLWKMMNGDPIFEDGKKTMNTKGAKNSIYIGVGFEWQIVKFLGLRGGYNFIQSSVSDDQLNFGTCDVDLMSVSAGLDFTISEIVSIYGTFIATFGFETEYQNITYDYDNFTALAGIRFKIGKIKVKVKVEE